MRMTDIWTPLSLTVHTIIIEILGFLKPLLSYQTYPNLPHKNIIIRYYDL